MNSTLRFGTALTVLALTTTLGGCGVRTAPKSASIFGGKVDSQNIGLATRAQVALESNHVAEAVSFAERAVAGSPTDAGFRALLGNSYFAAGRFVSAESAYRDSLTLLSNQPQVVLKLTLVSIAQGKNQQALAFLDAAKGVLDPSDYGLALALAGQPQQAAELLKQAAQQVGADSRVRQNLALAMALSGDWSGARSVAAQDVPGDQIDARIQQWMQLAKPAHASDQVASLTGITPAASDQGQPVRLALRDSNTRLAAIAAPVPVAEPAPVEVTEAPTPVQVAQTASPVASPEAPVTTSVVMQAPVFAAALTPKLSPAATAPRPSLSPRAAALTDARALYRHAALHVHGPSRAVVQLGAYASRSTVAAAWTHASARFGALRGYAPVAARYDGERGTVYRLSVQGFASARQAILLCGSLKRAGANCFVRNIAGDAPVQIASR